MTCCSLSLPVLFHDLQCKICRIANSIWQRDGLCIGDRSMHAYTQDSQSTLALLSSLISGPILSIVKEELQSTEVLNPLIPVFCSR
jgi:hypothetical protein